MKKILTFVIKAYQKTLNPLLHSVLGQQRFCRFEMTCSEYAIRAISKYGALRGSQMAIERVMHCHPFATKTLKYESI